jgi:hypothetical protein
MNDQDPDDLFDDLRRAWAESRPQPSASLWGRVQAQLPPPAVHPRLRRRKRLAGWLVSLLLLLLSGLSWHYWPTPGTHLGQPHRGSRASQAPRTASEPVPLQGNGVVLSQPDTMQHRPYPPGLATQAPAIAERAESGHGRGVRPPFATHSFVTDSSAATRVSNREKALAIRPLMPTTGASSATGLTRAAPPRALLGTVLPGSQARRLRKAAVSQLPDRRTSRVSSRERSSDSPPSADSPGSPELRAAPRQPEQNLPGLVSSTRPAPDTALSSSPGVLEKVAALAGRREPAGLAPERHPTLPGPGTTAIDLLALRRVALAAATFPLPDPHPRPDTSIAKPVAPQLRRWSIQVLAGPSRSYRQLGDEEFTLWGSPASLPPFPNRAGPGAAAANRRAEYESPGIGWSLQLQAQRVLTGRWSLSVGLGYQEYAVESLYPVIPYIITPTGLAPPYTSRDTYRLVSVPVRVSYTLGYVGPFRYGLLAGPDLALYLGGSSAGTDLRPQVWHSSGSPYRPLQVALNAGLDLRCQLGLGLQGIVQPSMTTYLTSLTEPETGLAPRYLQGVGIQVGLSYGLPIRQ